jgi:hypothetical protein
MPIIDLDLKRSVHERSDIPSLTTNDYPRLNRLLPALMVAAVVGLLLYKFFLVQRLNINWDEFFYLSHVHSVSRGDGGPLLQRFQTHLFEWITLLDGNEISQIAAARYVMVGLLSLTTFFVWRLGRIWLDPWSSSIPPFIYVASVPVMVHGGSFRADSLLAPIMTAALVLLFSPGATRIRDRAAGALLGLAFSITIKTVLAAPLVLTALLFRRNDSPQDGKQTLTRLTRDTARVAVFAGLFASALIAVHWLLSGDASISPSVQLGAAAAKKTLLDAPVFARARFLQTYVHWQPLFWLLLFLGAAIAIHSRRYDVASLGLALLPIAIYRNAFPYYYVVMLAPASVLAGYAVQEVARAVRPRLSNRISSTLLVTIFIGLLYQGLSQVRKLSFDDQAIQKALLNAVHVVFPEPVNYVDRCGMVSSFRKVNFFMSTWGMEAYRARNTPFMRDAIREYQPAFVLVNSPFLNPNQRPAHGLLPDDYELIARYYPRYWGPLRVAGASVRINSSEESLLTVPFPAEYRIRTEAPMRVDGILRTDGEVIFVPEEGIRVAAVAGTDEAEPVLFQLFLATAQPPPDEQLPNLPLFSGL